jgi:outer membrane immunogenic protein
MIKPYLAAAAALLAVPAFAAPAEPFNGPFVGVQGGWQQDHEQLRIDDAGTIDRFGDRKAGFTYGAQAGWDFRLTPQIVAGVEASATGRTGRERFDDGAGNSFRLRDGRTFGATARLGYLVTPNGLLYARGGYENARFKLDADGSGGFARNRDGYVAGVGYEQALTKTVSARLEYDYSNFGHDRLNGLANDLGVDSARVKYERNAVTAGLNLHF